MKRKKQEIFYKGENIRFSITKDNIDSVVDYNSHVVNANDCFRILYKGLENKKGLHENEFVSLCNSGEIIATKNRGQYTLFEIIKIIRKKVSFLRLHPFS